MNRCYPRQLERTTVLPLETGARSEELRVRGDLQLGGHHRDPAARGVFSVRSGQQGSSRVPADHLASWAVWGFWSYPMSRLFAW